MLGPCYGTRRPYAGWTEKTSLIFVIKAVSSPIFTSSLGPSLTNIKATCPQAAAAADLPGSIIKSTACWRSECYHRYIRISPSHLKKVPKQLASTRNLPKPRKLSQFVRNVSWVDVWAVFGADLVKHSILLLDPFVPLCFSL